MMNNVSHNKMNDSNNNQNRFGQKSNPKDIHNQSDKSIKYYQIKKNNFIITNNYFYNKDDRSKQKDNKMKQKESNVNYYNFINDILEGTTTKMKQKQKQNEGLYEQIINMK